MPYDYRDDPRYQRIREVLTHELDLPGHPRFYDLLAQMACMHADKNHDYAGDEDPLVNLRECERFGISAVEGVIARITDKDSRFRNWFLKRNLVVRDESILDTLLDRAVYTLLLMILAEEELGVYDGCHLI